MLNKEKAAATRLLFIDYYFIQGVIYYMGATTFYETARGKTPEQAFRAAVRQAKQDYGSGGYSGTIAEKNSFTLLELPKQYKENPEAYADHLIETDDARITDKYGPAGCILIRSMDITEQEVGKIQRTNLKAEGKREWETLYFIESDTDEGRVTINFSKFKDEAIKIAVDNAKETGNPAFVVLTKRLVKQDPVVFRATPTFKNVVVKNGLHEYLFFGWASD